MGFGAVPLKFEPQLAVARVRVALELNRRKERLDIRTYRRVRMVRSVLVD